MSEPDSDSGWGCLIATAVVLGLLYLLVSFLYENARIIALWIGPFVLVAGTWYGLRIVHRLFSTHPAKDAVKNRSIADADQILCRIEKGGLAFMHENQARNADKLRQDVEKETNKIRQKIENLEAELSRREAVNVGSVAEAIAAVRSSPHRDELRRSLVRRLAKREGIHVQG